MMDFSIVRGGIRHPVVPSVADVFEHTKGAPVVPRGFGHAAGKAGTPFHGWILNVAFYPGGDIEPLKAEHYWLGPLLALNLAESPESLVGRWIGRLPAEWVLYSWTREQFEAEMEFC